MTYYERNRERLLAYQAAYRLEHADSVAVSQASYRRKNSNKIKGLCSSWYRRNKGKVLMATRDWQERNKEKVSEYGWKRREERKVAVVNVLTNGEGTCRHCGQGDLDVLTIDHVNNDGAAHRREGSARQLVEFLIRNDYPPGFQVLCANCNLKKEVVRRRAACGTVR
jgi:hypothetical protein